MTMQQAYSEFQIEIAGLFLLEQRTQAQTPTLHKSQVATINEAILIRGFRAYENLLERAFLHYARGQPTLSNAPVVSFLAPRNEDHAHDMLRSSQTFLEWNKPDTVIERAECYLDQGGPIKQVIAAKREVLSDIRRVRNHIAHNSRQSLEEFKKVVRNYNNTLPLVIPTSGEFLNFNITRKQKSSSVLQFYLNELADISALLVS
jgi:hypothetical protein